jgi:hypothetical protein
MERGESDFKAKTPLENKDGFSFIDFLILYWYHMML